MARLDHRLVCRLVATLASRWVLEMHGLDRVLPRHDPFILVANHNQRPEAVLVPTLLIHHRGGERIHFLADWPMMLVPGVALAYRISGVLPVGNKSARWPALDRLRRHLVPDRPPLDRAADRLRAGASVGLFPEGTVHRDPERLLRGRPGAARLALETGSPILPVGLGYPHARGRIRDRDRPTLEVGEPLRPEPADDLRSLHERVMQRLAELSGKRWSAEAERKPSHGPS